MDRNRELISVLPDQTVANFIIKEFRQRLEFIDNHCRVKEEQYYKLEKVNSTSTDFWQVGYSCSQQDFKFIGITNDNHESLHSTCSTVMGKPVYNIELPSGLTVGSEIDFKICAELPAPVIAREKGFLFKRIMININRIFSTTCEVFTTTIVVNSRYTTISSTPIYTLDDNNLIKYNINSLRPHEFQSTVLYLHIGLISKALSSFITWLFLGIAGFGLGELLQYIF